MLAEYGSLCFEVTRALLFAELKSCDGCAHYLVPLFLARRGHYLPRYSTGDLVPSRQRDFTDAFIYKFHLTLSR